MRVLHASSDWKWTGAAEPLLLLLQALRSRGHAADLACPEPPSPELRSLASEARKRGVAPRYKLERGRGIGIVRDTPDVRRMKGWLEETGCEVVHAWHSRDHGLALRAAGPRRRAGATVLVRSLPGAAAPSFTPWNRWLLGPGCDGLLCVGEENVRANARLRGGRPLEGYLGVIDSDRFSPSRGPVPGALGLQGLVRGNVIGIVARMQRHRRFDLLLDAFALLASRNPDARLLVLGRGTHREEVAVRPARERGIADRVIFAGYRDKDYVEVLRCVDVLTFLVPGSDGTCRAVLEAAACGIPCVATRRGALPEIVLDGQTGLLVSEKPEELARAWEQLLKNQDLRDRMGETARVRVGKEFSPGRLAERVEALYEALRTGSRGLQQ